MVLRFNLAQIWHFQPVSAYICIWDDLMFLWLSGIQYPGLDVQKETLKYFRKIFQIQYIL